MALSPSEQASLALWLTAARCLDPDCCASEDSIERTAISAARGILYGDAAGAALIVNTDAAVASHLERAADKLAKLRAGPPVPPVGALSNVKAAEGLLRERATAAHQCTNGDSAAIGKPICDCGLLNLAALVELRVQRFLEENALLAPDAHPAIRYVTALTNDNHDFEPFRVNGQVNIRRQPRIVTIILLADGLTCRDLWHLAYTLHHELICHAFQGASSSRNLPNPHPRCHWSEGWMDTVAFDLVSDWVDDETKPLGWLPLGGEDAKGELWKFHDHRYVKPRGLDDNDIRRRRWAREAYRRLAKILSDCGMAALGDAEEIARRFALAANAHIEADCHRLNSLGIRLRTALLNVARPQAGVAAAAACLAFSVDHDLEKLEQCVNEINS
jgi:hypothetical protein